MTKKADEQAEGRMRLRAEERRALILKQAKKVFAQHSYAQASTSLLAQECGVSEPILYRHFSNKKGLFIAVLAEYSQRFLAQWQERVKQREAENLLQALAHVVLDYNEIMAADPDTHRILHQAVAEVGDADFARCVSNHNSKVAACITDLLTRAQQAGLLNADVTIPAATWGYLSMLYARQYSYVLNRQTELSAELIANMSQAWLRGLLFENRNSNLPVV